MRSKLLSIAMFFTLIFVGCATNGQDGYQTSGLGVTSSKQLWTIVIKRLRQDQAEFVDMTYDMLAGTKGINRRKIKKIMLGHDVLVTYGEYSGIDDSQAQKDMKFIKSLVIPNKGFPFLNAHLEPMPIPDPPMPRAWDLKLADGYWTLKIAQFDGSDRKTIAVEMVQTLREKQVPAYVYHGPLKSWVTIGAYPESAVKMSRGLKPVAPEMKRWKKEYPYLLINLDYAKAIFSRKTTADKELRLPSQIVKIPKGGSLW